MADIGIRIRASDEASGVFGKVGAEAGKLRSTVGSTEDGFKSLGGTASVNLGKMEMSARATTAAIRQVPAQFTDIITSLQGGQKPLTVLLQQGGQLKDMFGGVGNAAKGLGTYVVGLVNPFTAAAAAAGVLGFAFLQGQKESQEYQRVLLETGNAAGTTSTRLAASAANVAKSFNVTQGAAAGALAALAGTNSVATESFEKFSGLAVKMNEITGRAVGDTIKTLDELGKSPVEASIKYNEATHHLTASVYEQIKALSEQGKTAEAGALAQKAYFDAMNDRLPALEANLGLLERGWNKLAKGAKGAWDAMLNIGRPTDPVVGASNALTAAEAELARLQERASRGGMYGAEQASAKAYMSQLEATIAAKREELGYAKEVQMLADKSAARAKQSADETTGQIALDKIHNQYLRDDLKMQQEIAAVTEKAKAAPQSADNTKKLNESIAGIREKYSGEGTKSALAAQIQEFEDLQMEAVAIGERAAKALAAQHTAQLLDDRTFYARKREAALNANTDQQAVVELEKAAVASSGIKSAEKAAQIQRYNSELKKLREQALGIEDEYLNGLTAAAAKEQKIQDDYIAALGKAGSAETKRLTDAVAAQTQHNAEIGKTKEQIEEYKRAVQDAATVEMQAQADAITGLLERNAALIEYGDTLGLIGNQAKDIYEEELKNLKEQIAERKKLSGLYATGAQKEAAAAAAKASADEWKRGWEQTDQLAREVFSSWATDGSNAAQKIGDTLKKALLSAIYEATLKPLVLQLYSSVNGGDPSGATAGTGGGLMGLINGGQRANSLYNYGVRAYDWLTGASTASTTGAALGGTQIGGSSGIGSGTVYGGGEAVATTSSSTGALGSTGASAMAFIPLLLAAYGAGKDSFRVSSTGDSTSQFDASGKVINRSNQLFGGDSPISIPSIVNGVALADPRTPSSFTTNELALTDGHTQEQLDTLYAAQSATRDAQFAATNAAANKYTEGLNAAYLAAAKNLGVGAVSTNITFGTNDTRGGGGARLGLSAGSAMFDSGDISLNDSELKLAASRAILTALKGSDLPKYMQGVFDGVDAAKLDQAGIDNAIQAATDLKSAYEVLQTIPGQDLTNISYETLNSIKGVATELAVVDGAFFALGYTLLDVSAAGGEAAAGLAAAFGGLQAFQSQINSYAQNFLSPSEQEAGTYAAVQDQLRKVGIDYTLDQLRTATRADIRAAVDGLAGNVQTEEGAKRYAAAVNAANTLAGVKPALDKIAALPAVSSVGSSGSSGGGGEAPVQDAALSAWQDATDAIVKTMGDLRTTLVDSGPDSFSKLQAQFAIEVASAKAGNLAAAQDLPNLAKTLAEASKGEFTTSVQRDVFVARLLQSLGDVVGVGSAGPNLSTPNFVAGQPQAQTPVAVPMPVSYTYATPSVVAAPAVSNAASTDVLNAVLAELQAIRASSGSAATSVGKTARILDAASNNGQPISVRVLT